MKSAAELREAAQRYRQMATTITDRQTIEALHELAAEYEALADRLDAQTAHQAERACEP
jgi:hypothetical protein